jgi:hypothetical protein
LVAPTTSKSSCAKKQTYATLEEAQTHLDLLLLGQAFGGARAYSCDSCGLIHISGRPHHVYKKRDKREERARRERRKKRRRQDDDADDAYKDVRRNSAVASLTNDDRWGTVKVWFPNLVEVDMETKDVIAGQEPDHLGITVSPPVAPTDEEKIGYRGADFAWVPAKDIKVGEYQRDPNPSRVNEIAEGFDQRDDGLYALDGQHRVAAVIVKWGSGTNKMIPCLVYRGLSVEDEARIYFKMNKRRLTPSSHDAFKARLFFDPVAQAIKALLDARFLSLKAAPGSTQLRYGEIMAVSELEEIYKTGKLPNVLDIIDAAWRGEAGAHRGSHMRGIYLFLSRYHDFFYGAAGDRTKNTRMQRLIDALASAGPGGIASRAKFYRETIESSGASAMARAIHNRYNHNLRGPNRLPAWGADDDEEVD